MNFGHNDVVRVHGTTYRIFATYESLSEDVYHFAFDTVEGSAALGIFVDNAPEVEKVEDGIGEFLGLVVSPESNIKIIMPFDQAMTSVPPFVVRTLLDSAERGIPGLGREITERYYPNYALASSASATTAL